MVLGDPNPAPSFASPHADEATVTFAPVNEAGAVVAGARLFVGDYQARARAVADTDPATTLGNTVQLVPGTYNLLATAAGRGHVRVGPVDVTAGATTLTVEMPTNLASSAAGATVSGDGINLARIVDDDEATNWASLGSPVAGKQVTVDLAGRRPPGGPGPGERDVAAGGDGRSRRWPAGPCLGAAAVPGARLRGDRRRSIARTLRTSARCSRARRTPSRRSHPRPRAPELILRTFDIPDTTATHLRLEVLTNQCTGAPDYAGEQDADPRANTDCSTASSQALIVRVAEFQAFAA